MRVLPLLLLLSLLSFPVPSGPNYSNETTGSEVFLRRDSLNPKNLRVLLPIYIRLQALEKSNITLWESVPQNFSDHVATIDSRVLAMFIPSNSLSFNLSRDTVGNLWTASNYSLNAGDYISTVIWVSSETIGENLTSPGFVPFPKDYPDSVKTFLDPGRKMPVKTQAIQEIAANYNKTQNMTQTVKSTLDFVSEQEYDREKTRLLMSGNLNTTDILDFFEDAIEVLETHSSICIERSWCAAAILRAAGVPTRTVTDVRLKTWIQVWLGRECGWVDAEALCVQPPPMFPRPLSSSTPWMIENSSDAAFPFTWLPKVRMRVANLTFGDVSLFDVKQYRTVLSEPIDAELFRNDPTKFSFPIVFKPEIVYAALTKQGSHLTFSLFNGNENVSKTLTIGEPSSVALGDVAVSFKPVHQENFLVLQDFVVWEIWKFDVRILVPVVGVPVALVVVLLFWKKRRQSR